MVRITNNAGLPDSLVRATSVDTYDYENAGDISASALSKSPRQLWLERRHADEITEDASERLWKMIGDIGHKIVERAAPPNTLVEERLSTTVLGWVLTGKMDLLYEDGGYGIDDFKFTSTYAVKDEKPEWTAQLNTYAWLAKQHGFDIKRLRIIAVLRDWSVLKAAREHGFKVPAEIKEKFGQPRHEPTGSDYPQVGVVVREVPLWSALRQKNYVEQRVLWHQKNQDCPDDYLPECTDEERWAKPDTWAVIKRGGTRALRLLPSMYEAVDWAEHRFSDLKEWQVEHRPGNKTVKCDHYCPVNFICSQYKQLKNPTAD